MVNPFRSVASALSTAATAAMRKKKDRQSEMQGGDAEMSLVEHIVELRKYLMRSLFILFAFATLSFVFMDRVLGFLRQPFDIYRAAHPGIAKLISIGLYEVIVMNFKMCLLVALTASVPFILHQLWQFVSPALYPREKALARAFLFASGALFFSGVAFGFYVIVPAFLDQMLTYAGQYAEVNLTVESYYNSLTMMVVLFGVIFEVPVVMSLLGLAGLITSQFLSSNRRLVILASFVVGAVLSPPDVFSQMVVSVPLYLMCEISIIALKVIERNRAKAEAASPA